MSTFIKQAEEKFSVAAMLAQASAETGLNDFGDEEFREALTHLIDSTNKESTLSPMGAAAFKVDTHRVLVNRLRFAEDLKRHPEILDEDVSDPIVVMGLIRTGTTKLQRMLAADPGVQRLEHWRLYNPAPFPNAVPGKEDPRIEASRQVFSMSDADFMRALMESHPSSTFEVDEDVFLQHYTFKCAMTYLARPMPSYYAWIKDQSLRGTYEYTRKLLQYLQWQDGGKRGRPWIMKSPVHISAVDLILEQHPKATLVFNHRRLDEVIPSTCRLQELSWRLYSDSVDMKALGQSAIAHLSDDVKKHLELRKTMGSRLNIFDIQYERIKNDIFSVIREIYDRSGRQLTLEAERAMHEWEDKNSRHQGSKYKLEDYGLTRGKIDSAFGDYLSMFGNS